jgi:hypothetical protein
MNPVTFNDKIAEMTYADIQQRLMGQTPALDKLRELFPKWETSPLFLYDEPSNEAETTAIIKGVENEECFEHTPFPVFRLDINVGHTDKPHFGRYKAKALVANYPDGLAVFGRVDDLLHTEETYAVKAKSHGLPIWVFVHKVKQEHPGSTNFECSPDFMFGLFNKWKMADDIKMPVFREMCATYLNGLLKSVAAFNLSANAPNNHIAMVQPNQPGRSVEWLKARTHFTLIAHGHPANSASVRTGAKVTVDVEAEIKRLAHNRRGHSRTLRAARFRYARGKTIWVKATWVGPKEWQDAGGRQIYRILEPAVSESKAA